MADQADKNPRRSAADKERSRQQSRPVSGRDAKSGGQSKSGTQTKAPAKGAGNRPGGAKGSTGPGRGSQQGKGGGRPPGKGGSGRAAPAPPKRSSTPFIFGAIALVLVFVVVIVLVTVTGGSSGNSGGGNAVTTAPAAIVNAVTTIPDSAFDAVGVNAGGQQLAPPQAVTNGQKPFTYDGKPGFFFFGAEFCPYCAAERWALVATLARFGTFSNLDVTKSNSTDTDPNTATFSFRDAKYTSPYIGARFVENETGNHATLQLPDTQESALLTAFKVSGYPFMDVDNKYEENSPEYNPQILQGLSWNDIASNLHDPTNPITQTILASSNYMTAAICATTNGEPASVCKSKGVEAATKALATSGSASG